MASERLSHILEPEYLAGLESLSLEEVRARRGECQDIEVALSYARRLVQGRLDIIHAEVERRTHGGRSDASEIVDRLKGGEILAEHERPPGLGRLPTVMAPGDSGDEFLHEIDEAVSETSLGNLSDVGDADVRELAERLGTLERSLSDRRRAVFDRIDALQAEIVRRYKTGAVNPESLLS